MLFKSFVGIQTDCQSVCVRTYLHVSALVCVSCCVGMLCRICLPLSPNRRPVKERHTNHVGSFKLSPCFAARRPARCFSEIWRDVFRLQQHLWHFVVLSSYICGSVCVITEWSDVLFTLLPVLTKSHYYRSKLRGWAKISSIWIFAHQTLLILHLETTS